MAYQQEIIKQKSSIASKPKSKKYGREYTPSDCDEVRVEIKRYVISLKLAKNFDLYGQPILAVGIALDV